jgi:hypothetical protein
MFDTFYKFQQNVCTKKFRKEKLARFFLETVSRNLAVGSKK